MRQGWIHLAGPVAAMVGMVVTFYFMRNRMPLSPRQVRQQNRFTTPLMGLLFAAMGGMNWMNGQRWVAGFLVAVGAFLIVSFALSQRRSIRQLEAEQNFAVERWKCGRCEYDLTGNVSGVCPECGWEIPKGELDIDSPGWMFWWRKWEIERLRNWKKSAAFLVMMIVLLFAMGGVIAVRMGGAGALIMPAIVSANFGINLWRVVAYARKRPARERELMA